MQIQNIAIDGPVASGKTVVGRLVAQKLGWRFLDTGSMYRVVTWVALARQIDLDNEPALVSLATQLDFRLEGEAGERVLADGKDVTDSLRAPTVDRAVSQVAKVAGVRVAMVARQREVALQAPTVVVGRDIGTKVLPDGPVKVFLTASVEERASRRHKELAQRSGSLSYEEVRDDLERRDRIDTEREESPLRAATDAVILNTDALSVDEVVKRIMEMTKDAAS
jgi:cytidylate kinase